MPVVWTRAALDQVDRVHTYLAAFNPQAAVRVVSAIRDNANNLAHFPYRGQQVGGTSMRELVVSFPYLVRYRVIGRTIIIVRVRHAARQPTKP